MKITVHLESDERYPDYFLHEDGDAVEVEAEVAERWERVCGEYDAVQREMEAAWKAANS